MLTEAKQVHEARIPALNLAYDKLHYNQCEVIC